MRAEPTGRQIAARTLRPWLEKSARWQSGEIRGNGGSDRLEVPPAATLTIAARHATAAAALLDGRPRDMDSD
jgi:hypothetical protein